MIEAHPRERIIAGTGTAIVLGGAAALLLTAFDVPVARLRETALAMVDLRQPPPPKERVTPPRRPTLARNASSPHNLRNKATDVVAPPPVLPVSPPPPLVSAPAPDLGAAANSGASDRAGPGRGAGGHGDGTGGGGNGTGDETPPRQIRGRLSFGDLPAAIRAAGWSGKVDVRYRVETDGRVSGCAIDRPSGNPEVDALTCALITQRFRFRPSLDADRRPVSSTIVETHQWIIDRSDDRG